MDVFEKTSKMKLLCMQESEVISLFLENKAVYFLSINENFLIEYFLDAYVVL